MDTEINKGNKDVVNVRLRLPRPIHKKAMTKHDSNPRQWTFTDTIIDLIKKGLESPQKS